MGWLRPMLPDVCAMNLQHTIIVTDLLHRKEVAAASKITQRFKLAEYRVWLKCMEDIYPVQAYLHKINKAPSVIISDIPAL
jgi:hypothetical protein